MRGLADGMPFDEVALEQFSMTWGQCTSEYQLQGLNVPCWD